MEFSRWSNIRRILQPAGSVGIKLGPRCLFLDWTRSRLPWYGNFGFYPVPLLSKLPRRYQAERWADESLFGRANFSGDFSPVCELNLGTKILSDQWLGLLKML